MILLLPAFLELLFLSMIPCHMNVSLISSDQLSQLFVPTGSWLLLLETEWEKEKPWCGVEQFSNDENIGALSTLVKSQNQNLTPNGLLWRKLTSSQHPPAQQFIAWKGVKEMWGFFVICIYNIVVLTIHWYWHTLLFCWNVVGGHKHCGN